MTEMADDFIALMKEDLDPDLEPWLEEATFGTCLKHPLVYQVPHYNNGMANKALYAKRELCDQAVAESDWHGYVFLHERPYRFEAMKTLEREGHLDDDQEARWLLARNVWIDSENVWQHYDEWTLLFEDTGARFMMTEDEEAALAALPETVTIYRGATCDLNEDGLSWTLDHDRALWFAQRFHDDDEKVVIRTTIPREKIIAYFTSRSEDEIIALPYDLQDLYYEELS